MIELTLGEQLAENAKAHPDVDALVCLDPAFRMTWKQLDLAVTGFAAGLLGVGVSPGDNVSIWSTNRPEWVVAFLAVARLGAVAVTVDTSFTAVELERQLIHSQSSTLILSDGFKGREYVDAVSSLLPELSGDEPVSISSSRLPDLKRVIHFGGTTPAGMHAYTDLADSALPAAGLPTGISPDAPVNMQYTAAAAGVPKGVVLTHRQILNNGYLVGQNLKFTHRDRLCIPVPFFHAFGCSLGAVLCLAHAATMVPVGIFSPAAVLAAIAAEKCTAVHGVPTMFVAQLECEEFASYDLTSLRTGIMAGAPCPIEVMEQVISRMHAQQMTIAYGQTESGPIITQTLPEDPPERRVSTVGIPLPGVEVKIVDPVSGEECATDVSGELCARGPMIMDGYYRMPEETSQAIDADGWLHTGDLAACDSDGYYRITGRLRNMIIRGGQNIYPVEIEEFLQSHPAVEAATVSGEPDRKFGEIVAADVTLKEGCECDEATLRSFCQGHLAHYKVPAIFRFS